MNARKNLSKVTEKDVALMLFAMTFLDNLEPEIKDYWNIKSIHNRFKLFMLEMQRGSMSQKLIYKNGHYISDIAWYESKKDGKMIISPLALMLTFISEHSDRFDLMIGKTETQISGTVNKFYNDENIKSVKLNSWKIMKRLIKHLNTVMYKYEEDNEYIIRNAVHGFLKE